MNPLVQSLMDAVGLDTRQASGVVGLVLVQLKKLLSGDDFSQFRSTIPETDSLLTQAPATRGGGGLLGGLASLGGAKARTLLELSQGLSALNISADKVRPILAALEEAVTRHYPTLTPLLQKLVRSL